jgi:uncharacterized protein YjbJ (UPF0337 family)
MAIEKLEGGFKRAEGTVESSVGNATGDSTLEFKGKAKQVMGSAEDALGTAKDYVQDSYESVQTQVKAKPVQSALIALGIGYLIGRIAGL